jgi:hypothetical protein
VLDGYEKVEASAGHGGGSSVTTGTAGGQGGAGAGGGAGSFPLRVTAAYDYGDPTAEHSIDVALLAPDRAAVVGAFNGDIFADPNLLTAMAMDALFVAAVAPDGSTAWSRRLAATIDSPRVTATASGVAVAGLAGGASMLDFGNGFEFTPHTNPTAFVAGYDELGTTSWVLELSDAGGPFEVPALHAREGLVLAGGSFRGTLLDTFTNTSTDDDGFVAALDPVTGNPTWVVQVREGDPPPVDTQQVHSGGMDGSGFAYLAGSYDGDLGLNGACPPSINESLFVVKLDAGGVPMACLKITHTLKAEISAMTVAEDGSIVLAGTFVGNIDFGGGLALAEANRALYLARLNSDLAPVWAVKSSATGLMSTTAFLDVAFDGEDRIVAVGDVDGSVTLGSVELTAVGGQDIIVAVYSSDGNVLGATRFGGGGAARATAVDAREGVIVVGGTFAGMIDFGTGPLEADGSTPDAFVAWFSSQ